jgi:hypothetical protein
MIRMGQTTNAYRTYVNESSRQDDTSAELLQDDKDDAFLRHACERSGKYRTKDTDRTSHKNDK